MMQHMTTTGAALRDERIRAALSLSELARRMGRDRVTVWRWENQAIVTIDQAREYRAALACIDAHAAIWSDAAGPQPATAGGTAGMEST